MKKLSINLVKGLLVIVLFTGASVVLSTTGVKTVTEVQANVTETDVIDYLEENGYTVITADPKPGTIADWICHTTLNGTHYWATVHVCGNEIVGHEVILYQ